MPIIDIQRRMVEVGRIRMGHQVASGRGRRPAKLEHWRLTSRDSSRLEAAAVLYGGEVKPWEERSGEFELFTTTAELPILLLPGQTLSQWYETWSAGGCSRRCDGERDVISEGPCICDTEKGDRACKPTTRLSVMLPDVPGLGCWRLESHGYYAAVELSATAAMLEQATARGQLLPARIRIDQRSKVEGGKTTRYAVPVIDIDITVRQALPGATETAGALPSAAWSEPSGFTPITPALNSGVTLEQGLEAVNREAEQKVRSGRQAASMGPLADDILEASAAPLPVGDGSPDLSSPDLAPTSTGEDEMISPAQVTMLWATASSFGIPEEVLRDVIVEVTGQESTKLIPKSRINEVIERLERMALQVKIERFESEIVAVSEQRGNREQVQGLIDKHRLEHDAAEHLGWLRKQHERAMASVTA